jgi:hypothetical protein
MDEQADDKTTGKCPVTGGARAYTSRDWWPNQLNRLRHRRSGRDVDDGRHRFWNWLGTIPHFFYFQSLRVQQQLWSQTVIWTSLLGTFLTVVISAIYPDEPFPLPLNQLLYDLAIAARIAIPIR